MASKKARRGWESGIWLNEAWTELADQTSKAQLEAAPDYFEAAIQFAAGLQTSSASQVFKTLAAGSEAEREKGEIIRRMRERLIVSLLKSELVATGYRDKPSHSSSPVVIEPSHFDNPVIDWDNKVVSANGRQWDRVKVSQPDNLPKPIARGSRLAINDAIQELLGENEDLRSKRRKVSAQLIRDRMGVEHISGDGMSDGNLAKYLVDACGKKAVSH